MACMVIVLYNLVLLLCLPYTGSDVITPESDVTTSGSTNGDRRRVRRAVGSQTYASGQVSGDVILGGLFSVHAKGDRDGWSCGQLNEQVGIHRVEAMLYAVDMVNRDSSMLPNITVGVDIRDDCETVNTGLEQSLHFLQGLLGNRNKICRAGDQSTTDTGPITVGVIGPSYSSLAIQVASLLRLFKFPQISYAATSSELSEKYRFDYFMRTVPPDSFQAQTIVDIIRSMNWSAVFAINSRGSYGEGGMQSFVEMAHKSNICIADMSQVDPKMSPADHELIIRRFRKEPGVRVAVLFCDSDDIRAVLSAAKRLNMTGYFIWLASDFWGSKHKQVVGLEDVANGALTIELQTNEYDLKEFYKYFSRLTPKNNTRNPWFKEYWETELKCKLGNSSTAPYDKFCNETQSEHPHFHYDGKVLFVVDAVLAFAHALDDLHRDVCGGQSGLCHAMRHVTRDKLLAYLYNVTFNGTTGKVQFDDNGDAAGKYDILQYRNTGESGKYFRVGNWIEGTLSLDTKDIKSRYLMNYSNGINSQCGQPCRPGFVRRMHKAKCCWSCEQCDKGAYVSDNDTCVDCPEGKRPDASYKTCELLPVKYLDTAWKAVIIAAAGLGILATIFIIGVFIHYRKTALIMAAGREVSSLLFIGVIMCYTLAFVMVIDPDATLCAIRRFATGISFCLCYTSLLVKTNRIARIFSGVKSPSFISPKSQLLIIALIMTPELAITLLEFFFSPLGTKYTYHYEDFNVVACSSMTLVVILKLCYNFLLILLCTYFAFRTRKTPLNFNEAKFIGFCMYTTCVVWLAFLPMYFGTDGYEPLAVCFSSVLSATTILVFIFAPKVYTVIFKPEKNLKSNSRLRSRSKSVEFPTTDNDSENERVNSYRGTTHSPTLTRASRLSQSENGNTLYTLEVPKITYK